jgi:hypothetical protein
MTVNSQLNSDPSTTLTISYSINQQYINLSAMVITLPPLVGISTGTACYAVSSNLLTVTCQTSSPKVIATFQFRDPTPSLQVTFSLSLYINYPEIQNYDITI